MFIFHYSPKLALAVGRPIEVGAEGISTKKDVPDQLEKKMAMREAVISANYRDQIWALALCKKLQVMWMCFCFSAFMNKSNRREAFGETLPGAED